MKEKEPLVATAGGASVNRRDRSPRTRLFSRTAAALDEPATTLVADAPPTGKKIGQREFWTMLATLVVLTVADTVLIAVLMYYYTDTYAQYVNQGTGLVYALVSIPIVLLVKRHARNKQAKNANGQALFDPPDYGARLC